jgi:hypothetical protein
MRSTFDVLRLLHSCGYRYARLNGITYEDGHTVVLFTMPHGQSRRAFTAFISKTETDRPHLEVEPGFVVDRQGEIR